MTYYASNNRAGWRADKRFSLDEPALAFMARGMGGDALSHWEVVDDGSTIPLLHGGHKPPYRVPMMAELAAPAPDAPTVVSTFAGCGGSCLGYRMAGYRVLWANEMVPIAAESYRANASGTILDTRDIRQVMAGDVLAATGLERGELDLLDGSPPCQPFSTAGKRHKSWGQLRDYGDHRQRADDLFFEYVRLLDGLQPRTFVAENVSGLVKGTAKGYFKRILAALEGAGYVVQARLLDAQWLGVPQARQRVIFVGVRADLGRAPVFPTPLPYRYSVRDALPWIVRGNYGPDWRMADAPRPTVSSSLAYDPSSNHQGLELVEVVQGSRNAHSSSRGERVPLDRPVPTILVGTGHQFDVIEQRVIHDTGTASWGAGDVTDRPCPTRIVGQGSRDSAHYRVETRPLAPSRLPAYDGQAVYGLTVVDPERPSPTVTIGSPGNDIAPPVERRKFTIDEVKRLCGFPDDFILCGSYAEQWARLGNAVPPVMMFHIAAVIRDRILRPVDGQAE